ncbi:DNA polymerase III subunit beta [Kitasatospora sp. NPDC058048]|uniref:DNA polymerase III subunit beta n=1 Tax=Kitasatospora sp. NPDC058048 TaxID=3346313 RepID=UPI0036DCDBC3
MKIRVSSQHLADAVAYTARAIATRPVVPVMAGILLTAGQGGLELAASDHEVYATDRLHAEVADEGRELVPGRLLADITARLPKGADVDLDSDGTRLTIACRTARFSLPLLPVDEYPALPGLPPAVATVQADTWADACAQIVIAASTDQSLPILTGVHLTLDGDQAVLNATDRYRIGWRRLTVTHTGPAADQALRVLIPAKTAGDTARAFASDRPLTLHSDGDGLFGWSTTGGRTFTTRLLSGEYPKLADMIPDAHLTVTVPADEMAAAVQRVALVAERNTALRLTVLDGELLIEGGCGDDAHGADTIPATIVGDPGEHAGPSGRHTVAFNPGYLADGIKACAADEVTLHLGHPHKPGRITAHTGPGDDEPYRYVLMPVRLTA